MSKQRLIDANMLKDALFQKHVHDEEELEPMLYLDDAMKVVDEAPTIDSIPMDWMDAQIRGYASALKSTELKALVLVKQMWEKDQEAR